LVVVTQQVQHAMDDQVRPVSLDRFCLLGCLTLDEGRTNNQITQQTGFGVRRQIGGEG